MNSSLPSPRILAASALAFTLIFLAFPQLDLIANGVFYSPQHGFLLTGNVLFDTLRAYLGILVIALLATPVVVWGLSKRAKNSEEWRARRPAALFLALSLLLGPGLLVNTVFKDHWGRARPSQIEAFGGTARFTPAWVISDQCHKNCSFVCGDASVGFALLAIAFVSRRPRLWLFVGLVTGSALGLMRMGQGGHFFSDVIFSFYSVYFAAWALHRFMTRGGRPMFPLD
ncbi:MAG: phosphatase PAP2 family protein [Pseudomonadota bacterium]|nr:phosphatase PAP2 family protein [Pseudomonadota bacterium]